MSAAAWALWQVRLPVVQTTLGTAPENATTAGLADVAIGPAFDASAFNLTLWNVPIQPAEATASDSKPLPTPNLELIAIITEDDRCLAAIYDSNSDCLQIAAAGQRIGRLEVVRIDPTGVDLRDGSRNYRLVITPAPESSARKVAFAEMREEQP